MTDTPLLPAPPPGGERPVPKPPRLAASHAVAAPEHPVKYRGRRRDRGADRLQIQLEPLQGETVVSLFGDLVAVTAHLLDEALVAAGNFRAARIVVDLESVAFCDPSGLRTLQAGHARLVADGRMLVVRSAPATLTELVTITGDGAELIFE